VRENLKNKNICVQEDHVNKKIASLGLCAMIIIASCKFLKKNETPAQSENAVASHLVTSPIVDSAPSSAPGLSQPQSPEPEKPASPKPVEEKPITQYDTARLDNEVREEALKLGKDPAKYRKIVRIEPDGTKIYRQIGMHVIVSPNQEEVFLPDEI